MAADAIPPDILAAAPLAVSLRASLQGVRPEIWRKLHMRSTATMVDVHPALQAVVGWWDYHLYEFTIDGVTYDCEDADLSSVSLAHILGMGITGFHYLYDFGDRWHVIIDVENAAPRQDHCYPCLIAAGRNAPPEDVGGAAGYENYVDTLKNGTPSERQELREWRGKFDPAKVDVMDIHKRMVAIGGSAAPGADQTGDKGPVMASAFYSPKF